MRRFSGSFPKVLTVSLIITLILVVIGNPVLAAKKNPQTLKITFIAPFSVESTMAKSAFNGFDMALNEVNYTAGNIKIKVNTADDKNDPTLSESLAERLNYDLLIGPMTTACAKPVANTVQNNMIPMIAPSASNPYEITYDGYGTRRDYIFSTCFDDNYEAQMAAKFSYENLSALTAVVLCQNGNEYSEILAPAFRDAFTKLGGQVTYLTYDFELTNLPEAISQIGDPDIIYLPGFQDRVILIGQQIRAAGIDSTFIGSEAWGYGVAFPSELQGSYIPNYFAVDCPDATDWVQSYETFYPGEKADGWAVLGYDTGKILIEALTQSGSISPDALRNAIQNIKSLQCASGIITIGDDGRPLNKEVYIQTILEGELVYYSKLVP